MRIATIDVGTNTALLLIVEANGDQLTMLYKARRYVRLGEGVDATGQISNAALVRLREALVAYQASAAEWGAEIVYLGGTSASRDAANGDELIAYVKRETGLDYTIISGEEEAKLTYEGATRVLPGPAQPSAVIDVGGGSTEVIFGNAEGQITYQVSLNIGSVRLTERFFSQQPPVLLEREDVTAFIQKAIADIPSVDGHRVIGASGTARVLAYVATEAVEAASCLAIETVRTWSDHLLMLTRDEVFALAPEIMEGRADVFPVGVLVLRSVLDQLGATEVQVSAGGVKYGMAWAYLRRQGVI